MDSTIIAAIIGAVAIIVVATISILTREPKQKQSAGVSDPIQKPKPIGYLFLAGCGVGNRIALLPLPPGQNNDIGLNEFINALEKIGLTGPVIASIIEARDKLMSPTSASLQKDVIKGIAERFFDTMLKIPEMVRPKCSADDFRWFKFGELLYEVATSAILSQRSEKSSPTGSAIIALDSLVEGMNLPSSLHSRLNRFVQRARTQTNSGQLLESANQITQAVFSLI